MTEVSMPQMVGEFESIKDQEDKITDLKLQIKALSKDNSDRMAEFAKGIETKPKFVKEAYKHWKEAQNSDDPSEVNDDLYTLLANLDMYLTDENNKDKEPTT